MPPFTFREHIEKMNMSTLSIPIKFAVPYNVTVSIHGEISDAERDGLTVEKVTLDEETYNKLDESLRTIGMEADGVHFNHIPVYLGTINAVWIKAPDVSNLSIEQAAQVLATLSDDDPEATRRRLSCAVKLLQQPMNWRNNMKKLIYIDNDRVELAKEDLHYLQWKLETIAGLPEEYVNNITKIPDFNRVKQEDM